MRTLIIVVTIFLGCFSNRYLRHTEVQMCEYEYDQKLKCKVYSRIDHLPEFPGGRDKIFMFILKNMFNHKHKYIQARINIELIIDAEGNVIDEHIKNKAV